MSERAERYQKLAAEAREDPKLSRVGMTLAMVFMAIGALDSISTNFAIAAGAYEVNGVMRVLQKVLGPVWFVPKMMLHAMVASMIIWSPNRPTIIVMTVMTAWTATVVVNNFLIGYHLS